MMPVDILPTAETRAMFDALVFGALLFGTFQIQTKSPVVCFSRMREKRNAQ